MLNSYYGRNQTALPFPEIRYLQHAINVHVPDFTGIDATGSQTRSRANSFQSFFTAGATSLAALTGFVANDANLGLWAAVFTYAVIKGAQAIRTVDLN